MLTPEQKEARRHGIGGSDAAAILGLSPWASAWDVYMRLSGVEQEERPNERFDWGHALEPLIRAEYTKRTGRKVWAPDETFKHPVHPWMIANVDALGPRKSDPGLEIKTVATQSMHHWGPEGTDQIPDYYLPQVAHYMAVLDVDEWDVAAFFGDFSMRIYTVKRDREFEAVLIEEERALWERVQRNEPPPMDGSDGARAWLKARYPRDERPIEDATPEETAALYRLLSASQQIKHAEDVMAVAKNYAIAAIGNRLGLKCELGLVVYRTDKNGRRSLRASWRDE